MSTPSPTREAFRAAFHRPALTCAEISWRWAVGATASALTFFYVIEYLNTLPVSSADLLLLGTRQPALIGRAIGHILKGTQTRAALAALAGILTLSAIWIIAASIGRLATVRTALDYVRARIQNEEATLDGASNPLRTLIGLNFLRVATMLATILALCAATIAASRISNPPNPRPGLAILVFLLIAGTVCTITPLLNWWLSFAAIFAARDRDNDPLSALSESIDLFRRRIGPILSVSTWTGLAHLVAFSVATTAASFSLAFLRIVPGRVVIAAIVLITLAYFAVADWLYIARLAGYIYIAEMPDAPPVTQTITTPQSPQLETSIDHNERILSDLPNLALET